MNARRRWLRWIAGAGVVATAGGAWWLKRVIDPSHPLAYPMRRAAAGTLPATPACADDTSTPSATEGPFYTPDTPERSMLREPGTVGSPLRIEGRIVDGRCVPVAGAVVDAWSCDGDGAYDNEGFRLRGHQYADHEGRFVFETVRPAAYGQAGFVRAPHVHLKLQGANTGLLTTQLFFPGAPENARDWLFDERLLVELTPDGGLARFTFVLPAA
jgi:protocatechuate 3,4-dioxygenase beta subunit